MKIIELNLTACFIHEIRENLHLNHYQLWSYPFCGVRGHDKCLYGVCPIISLRPPQTATGGGG